MFFGGMVGFICWVVEEDELAVFLTVFLFDGKWESIILLYIYLWCVLYHVCFPTVFGGKS